MMYADADPAWYISGFVGALQFRIFAFSSKYSCQWKEDRAHLAFCFVLFFFE